MGYKDYAVRFATALTDGDFTSAHDMLAPDLKSEYPVDELETRFREMVEYGDSPARVDGFAQTMVEWPSKGDKDLGWVYVSISGDDFGEAITVVVTEVASEMAIGSLEFGRP